jgi:hypothetical protein
MITYTLLTRIYRVTEDSVFLENIETDEDGIPFHISVRLNRMDSDDGEEFYQRPTDPSEMAHIYHENYGIMCTHHTWNATTKKHEWDGAPPKKAGLTAEWVLWAQRPAP